VPQCPIAGDATGLEGDFSRTVRVYGSHNTETTVRLFIVCIVVKESGTPENIYACGLRSRFRLLAEPVYTHGQLHVASSRCGDPINIRFFLYRMVRLQTSSTQKCCHVDTHLCRMCRTLLQ